MNKLERLLGTTEPRGTGLEIGPLSAPLVRKPAHDVRYVDYATTEVVKANQFDPSVKVDDIVEVDLVWGGAPLAVLAGAPVDYVVASHVIEHVPDLIGWLLELADVLRPGGVLGLAVPDKRFTFDALRKTSVLAEAVEAWLAGLRQPSPRQIFDAASLGVAVDAADVWGAAFQPAARRDEVLSRLRPALDQVRRLAAEPQYTDAHCWVFTPESFLDLAEEFSVLALFPFRIDAFYPTEQGAAEFHVRLVRAAPDAPEIRDAIAAARGTLGAAQAAPAPTARPDHDAALAAQVERLSAALDEIRTSRSWKLTAPLRALRRGLRI
jgi:SAM-dependent methyltransferase